MEILFLLTGLLVLWVGSELVVNATLTIGKYYNISPLFLGLTLVSFGTDLPETAIVLNAVWQKFQGIETSALIIGEILGSSISQVSLILGITALLGVITIKKQEYLRDAVMLMISTLLLFILLFNGVLGIRGAFVLLTVYAFYLITIVRDEKVLKKLSLPTFERFNKIQTGFLLLGGFLLLIFGAHITVTQALALSEQWHIPQIFIGTVIVGLGTSLPELVTAMQALRKRVGGLAIGGLLGSTIYDIIVPVALSAIVTPMIIDMQIIYFDIPILFAISLMLFFVFLRDKYITRKEAIALIGIYLIYVISQIMLIL